MTPEERFNARVREESSGCWVWLGAVATGQPVFEVAGRRMNVRRWAWLTYRKRTIPRFLGTKCGDPLCVRPVHLVAVRAGPKPKPGPKPDEIVLFMQENPSGHKECMRRFRLSETDLIEILDSYYSDQPRTDEPTETAPLYSPRKHAEKRSFEQAIAQLLESTDELW